MNVCILPLNIGIASLLTKGGLHYLIATAIGVVTQLVITFFINRHWTFKNPDIKPTGGLMRTSIVELTSLANILVLTAVGVEWLQLEFTLARLSAMVIAGIVGYILDSYFTFRTSPFR